MNKIFFSFILICCGCFTAIAQNNEVLLTIDGREVSKEEFEYVYNKNNSNLFNETDKKTPKEYLDLFVDFKLKVIEAENLKMDTSQSFINELAGYRKEIAAPYLTDIKYDEELVHEMYRRMSIEINAGHILLRIDKGASATKEKEVLERITSIREEILKGKDFGEAAVAYSEDPSAKSNKGNLGYFSAFMMVYAFENAAFSTQKGEISEPVRTGFGYHLIKVHDIRKNQGEIQVAHIMKAKPKGASQETIQKLKSEIEEIYKQLEDGADFAELAKKESDDKRSAAKGGEMPWFSAGKIIPEFSKPAFSIKNTGDYTTPVETKFGFHIIKKLKERSIAPFEEAKAGIESKIKRDAARRTSSKKAFINNLKEAYNFSETDRGKELVANYNPDKAEENGESTIFFIDGKDYKMSDFINWRKEYKTKNGGYVSFYDQWIDEEITDLEDSKLEAKYPEFRFLMKEYHDGILLFNISQEKIWEFAAEDSVGLEAFYEKNKDKNTWGERFKGAVINCENLAAREKVDDLIGAGLNFDEVKEHLNTDKELVKIETGAWEKGVNQVVDFYVWNGVEPEGFDSGICFIRGDKIEPEPKMLDEARGLFISDYQKYLEEEWLKELHAKYKVKVNKKLLKTIALD